MEHPGRGCPVGTNIYEGPEWISLSLRRRRQTEGKDGTMLWVPAGPAGPQEARGSIPRAARGSRCLGVQPSHQTLSNHGDGPFEARDGLPNGIPTETWTGVACCCR